MQKRLARKRDLEILLSKTEAHPTPEPSLEQYTISADAAATMLYVAAHVNSDIVDKTVLDLGCGTGRLAIGAAFLGAEQVVGVDVDRTAVKVAFNGSARACLKSKIQWVATTLDGINGKFDTVLQNPPFGVQKHGADRKFLEKALRLGRKVYSLHKSASQDVEFMRRLRKCANGAMKTKPSAFLEKLIDRNGGHVEAVYTLVMTIPYMFEFHTKRKHEFPVDLYVIRTRIAC